eukprot:1311957-Prymnesium_polylepis.1
MYINHELHGGQQPPTPAELAAAALPPALTAPTQGTRARDGHIDEERSVRPRVSRQCYACSEELLGPPTEAFRRHFCCSKDDRDDRHRRCPVCLAYFKTGAKALAHLREKPETNHRSFWQLLVDEDSRMLDRYDGGFGRSDRDHEYDSACDRTLD